VSSLQLSALSAAFSVLTIQLIAITLNVYVDGRKLNIPSLWIIGAPTVYIFLILLIRSDVTIYITPAIILLIEAARYLGSIVFKNPNISGVTVVKEWNKDWIDKKRNNFAAYLSAFHIFIALINIYILKNFSITTWVLASVLSFYAVRIFIGALAAVFLSRTEMRVA
jgi:intracellular septation protein A